MTNKPADGPKCASCPYWQPPVSDVAEYGECRLNPPVSVSVWPQTRADTGWCAQHPDRKPVVKP